MVKAIRARIRQFFKAFQKRNIQYMISISFTIVAITGMLFLGMALYLRFAASTQNMVEEDNKQMCIRDSPRWVRHHHRRLHLQIRRHLHDRRARQHG